MPCGCQPHRNTTHTVSTLSPAVLSSTAIYGYYTYRSNDREMNIGNYRTRARYLHHSWSEHSQAAQATRAHTRAIGSTRPLEFRLCVASRIRQREPHRRRALSYFTYVQREHLCASGRRVEIRRGDPTWSPLRLSLHHHALHTDDVTHGITLDDMIDAGGNICHTHADCNTLCTLQDNTCNINQLIACELLAQCC